MGRYDFDLGQGAVLGIDYVNDRKGPIFPFGFSSITTRKMKFLGR